MCKTHAQLLADGCHCDCIRLPAMDCSGCPTCDLHCMSSTAEHSSGSSGCATASECHENQTLMHVGRYGKAKCVDRKLHFNCTACDSYNKSTGGDNYYVLPVQSCLLELCVVWRGTTQNMLQAYQKCWVQRIDHFSTLLGTNITPAVMTCLVGRPLSNTRHASINTLMVSTGS